MARIRFADLVGELPTVELRSGREVKVQPIDAVCADLRAEYEITEDPRIMWQIAARVAPAATPEEIKALGFIEVLALVEIAGGKAEEVLAAMAEEARGKAKEGNPTAPTQTSPRGRRRRTGSASSSTP